MRFTRDCFSSKQEWFQFKRTILPQCDFSKETLLNQLKFLKQQTLTSVDKNIILIHGKEDNIAPISEVETFTPLSKISSCGHCPFFHTNFETVFNTALGHA